MNQSKSIQNKNGAALKGSKQNKSKARGKANSRQPKDRSVSAPTAKGKVQKNKRPLTVPAENGDIVISHREFISDVAGSVAFAATKYSVNPGLPGTFPWLSTVARSYESYRFEKLEFAYETQAPSTTPGTAILSVDYDASDATPTTKTQAMAYRSSVRSPSWSDCEHMSLKEDLSKRSSYFVRSGSLAANSDVNLYDVGSLFVCTQAQSGSSVIGELYVDYKIRLMTPQIGNVGIGEAIYGIFSGTSNAAPFSSSSGNLPATVGFVGTTPTSNSTWTFTQPWEGFVTVNLTGTGLSNVSASGGTEIFDLVDAGGTRETALYSLSIQAGGNFLLSVPNTTISAAAVYFAQADA